MSANSDHFPYFKVWNSHLSYIPHFGMTNDFRNCLRYIKIRNYLTLLPNWHPQVTSLHWFPKGRFIIGRAELQRKCSFDNLLWKMYQWLLWYKAYWFHSMMLKCTSHNKEQMKMQFPIHLPFTIALLSVNMDAAADKKWSKRINYHYGTLRTMLKSHMDS